MLLMGVVLLSDETIRGRLSVASNCFPIFALPKAASHRFAKPMSKIPSHESIWRPPHYVDQSFVRHHQINRCKIFPRGSGLHKRDKPPRWKNWLRGLDLNQRPSGYEPDELPGCSTPRANSNSRRMARNRKNVPIIVAFAFDDAVISLNV
jgi:hypothetical protein